MEAPADDAGEARALDRADERLCSMPDRGEQVIFHPRAQRILERYDAFNCPDCGESNAEKA